MKTILTLAAGFILAAGVASAQQVQVATEAEKAQKAAATVKLRKDAPNEITRKRVAYSGVFVQVSKAEDPLQVINPRAPMSAGDGTNNLAVDPIDKKPRGLAFFRLRW